MNYIKASTGIFLTIIITCLFIFFLHDISLNILIVIILCYVDIWFFKIYFEYQRITLIISRIYKLKGSTLQIFELQVLMAEPFFAVFASIFDAVLSGFIIGYFIINSVLFLFIFLLLKYFLVTILPAYIPYHYLFKLINKEIHNMDFNNAECIEKMRLKKLLEEIPHTSEYENWAVKKYGNVLLSIK